MLRADGDGAGREGRGQALRESGVDTFQVEEQTRVAVRRLQEFFQVEQLGVAAADEDALIPEPPRSECFEMAYFEASPEGMDVGLDQVCAGCQCGPECVQVVPGPVCNDQLRCHDVPGDGSVNQPRQRRKRQPPPTRSAGIQ